MKKALITGSQGFVGHYLRQELEQNGYEVTGLDIQAGANTGADHHGGMAQKARQGLLHHKVQRRYNTANDSIIHITDIVTVEGEQIHQVNADLVCGFASVGIQYSQEA